MTETSAKGTVMIISPVFRAPDDEPIHGVRMFNLIEALRFQGWHIERRRPDDEVLATDPRVDLLLFTVRKSGPTRTVRERIRRDREVSVGATHPLPWTDIDDFLKKKGSKTSIADLTKLALGASPRLLQRFDAMPSRQGALEILDSDDPQANNLGGSIAEESLTSPIPVLGRRGDPEHRVWPAGGLLTADGSALAWLVGNDLHVERMSDGVVDPIRSWVSERSLPESTRLIAARRGQTLDVVVSDESGTFRAIRRENRDWNDPHRIGPASQSGVFVDDELMLATPSGDVIWASGRISSPFSEVVRVVGLDTVQHPSRIVVLGWGWDATDQPIAELVQRHRGRTPWKTSQVLPEVVRAGLLRPSAPNGPDSREPTIMVMTVMKSGERTMVPVGIA